MHNRLQMKTRLQRRLRIAATVIVSLAGLVLMAFLSTFYYLKPTLPDVAQLRDVRLQIPLRVYSRDGRLLGQIGEQRRVPVTWEQIPQVVVQAVLAAEDDRFFQHPGVDWQGVVRAVLVAAFTGEATQGGSTLTQQLVRTTLITNERQLRRKLREIFLSLQLENELTKNEIFTLFVNTQFLGQRSYGFAAASETYFGKSLGQVNASEAALLAGILKAPSKLNPVGQPAGGDRPARLRAAPHARTRLSRRQGLRGRARRRRFRATCTGRASRWTRPMFPNSCASALYETYGEGLYTDGYKVVTTIDSRLQRAADVALRSAVLEYDRRHGYRGRIARLVLPAKVGRCGAGDRARALSGRRRAAARGGRRGRPRGRNRRRAQPQALPPADGGHALGAVRARSRMRRHRADETPRSRRGRRRRVRPADRRRGGAARAVAGGPGRVRRARSARRRDRRDVGRLRLPGLQVQPRDPGAQAAGFVVQALHLFRRARGRIHARVDPAGRAGRLRKARQRGRHGGRGGLAAGQ